MNITKFIIVCLMSVIIISIIYNLIQKQTKYKHEQLLRSGITDLKTGNFRAAYKKIKPYAEEGNRSAQRTLGDMYAYGLGVPCDEVQAAMWFRRSESGKIETGFNEYDTAITYLNGLGGQKQNPDKALLWFIKAAEAGNLKAIQFLSNPEALNNKGFKVDPIIVKYWKTLANS
ncbi:tetratricopeptide repeat protein [Trichlorobacter lovleyi]|uniref:tetratricopeptide repeat protein n=1 Tax=Trichlorobacter lovleyi TaxID=313985 RepID=UPI002480BCAB|nr:tetratricopeptide repeat protein [Trichlorobacter lovleyi]